MHRFFSSPMEYTKTGQELIAEMDKPEVWDALLALDQALSPIEEYVQTPEGQPEDPSSLLTRLSQKFKKTPTRFTEKLVSIIEDSVMSIDQSTDSKPNSASKFDVSLNRMTGEFRKLCKYIEDESMPEWAPTLNMTLLEKTEMSEINTVPKNPAIKRILGEYGTPKSKAGSKSGTPNGKLTPSADKSFEYWETVCNLMCKNQESASKKNQIATASPTQAKRSMDEMLVACERQMAMLDETHFDLRSSEPCKKPEDDLKAKILQTPRSKSVSKLFFNLNEQNLENEKVSCSNNVNNIKETENDVLNNKLFKEKKDELFLKDTENMQKMNVNDNSNIKDEKEIENNVVLNKKIHRAGLNVSSAEMTEKSENISDITISNVQNKTTNRNDVFLVKKLFQEKEE